MRNILPKRINKPGLIGFLLFVFVALFAGILSPYDPYGRFEPYALPSAKHLLGTNDMGQDILSELIYGTRVSLIVGTVNSSSCNKFRCHYRNYRGVFQRNSR